VLGGSLGWGILAHTEASVFLLIFENSQPGEAWTCMKLPLSYLYLE
jgi:hypothetical protein